MDFGFEIIHSLAGKSKIFDWLGIFVAEYLPYLVLVAFVIGLLAQRPWRVRLTISFFAALSLLISWGVIKPIIAYILPTDRPFIAGGFEPLFSASPLPSFPSDHATIFFCLATIVFLQMSSRWGVIMFVIAASIGFARIFAGVHYPADVIMGALIGVVTPVALRALAPSFAVSRSEEATLEVTTDEIVGG